MEKEEVVLAMRMQGKGQRDEVEAVILKSNGQLSGLSKSKGDEDTTISE